MSDAATYIDPRGTLANLFWAKVDKSGPALRPELGPCWVWTAFTDRFGYGRFTCRRPGRGPQGELAHRVSWYLAHGRQATPCALHHCDNPRCVRPSHLFEGTVAENNRDMATKGRCSSGERHPRRKLTEHAVNDIRAGVAAGKPMKDLAREYGVDPSLVSLVVARKVWRHV